VRAPSVSVRVHFETRRSGRKALRIGPAPEPPPPGRIPRVTRLMALAIRFDHLIRTGEVRDMAELARLGMVTRARVTQIMNLLLLAPAIQEAVLYLDPVESGRDPITERDLRPIAAVADWDRQQQLHSQLRMTDGGSRATHDASQWRHDRECSYLR